MKTIQRILAFLLSIILLIVPIVNPIPVYADGGASGTGGGHQGTTHFHEGGFSADAGRVGYRMYVIDDSGSVVSDVVDIVWAMDSYYKQATKILNTRYSGGKVSRITSAPTYTDDQGQKMPKPVEGGEAQGSNLKTWVSEGTTDGKSNAWVLVSSYLGSGACDLFMSTDDYYLIIEPVFWHTVSGYSKVFYGTSYNWLQMLDKLGISYSDNYFGKFDNYLLQVGIRYDKEVCGITAPSYVSAKINYEDVGDQGYGIEAFWNKEKVYQTWDEKRYPATNYKIEKSPDPVSFSGIGSMTVIKNYRTRNADGSLTDDDPNNKPFIRPLTPGNILIQDEAKGYKVVGWKISSKEISRNDKLDSTKWADLIPGNITQEGDEKGTVSLNKSNDEKALYVLLEKTGASTHTYDKENHPNEVAPAPDDSKNYPAHDKADPNYECNIIKVYRTEDSAGNVIKYEAPQIRKSTVNVISVESEDDYKLREWKTSTSYKEIKTWSVPSTVKQSGTSPETITLNAKGGENNLYVLLVKQEKQEQRDDSDADYIVNESQITRHIGLSVTDKNEKILDGYKFKWNYGSLEDNCSGHSHTGTRTGANGKLQQYNYTTNCSWSIVDGHWTLNIKNKEVESYPEVISYKAFGDKVTGGNVGYDRSELGSGSLNENHDYKYDIVIHRGNDKLTFADWKDGTGKDLLSDLDHFVAANQPQGGRKENGSYTEKITVDFESDASDTTTTSKGSEGCSDTDDIKINPLKKDITIKYYVYHGEENGGTNNTDVDTSKKIIYKDNAFVDYSNFVDSGVMVKNVAFSFYPYVQMRYDTLDQKDIDTWVLGEYKRSMTTNDAAEIVYETTDKATLNVTSKQWSTSSQTKKDMSSAKGLQKAIPGGAVIYADTKDIDRTLDLITYQVLLKDDGKTQVKNTTGSVPTYNDQHTSAVKSITEGIENTNMVLWLNSDMNKDPFDGAAVRSGSDISFLDNGSNDQVGHDKASTDSKYYFKSNSSENRKTEGDIDVISTDDWSKDYTFSSNTKGQILMNGEVILEKDQDADELTNKIAKTINDHTYIVTKLCDAIERNTGNDSDASRVSDGHWYNEAFDGVTVRVKKTTFHIGLSDPKTRQNVIDPKLIPNTTSKVGKDNNGNHEANYFSAAYRLNNYSDKYKNISEKLGTFEKKDLRLDNLQNLFKSNIFYIPNQTVQDLR